jgi:hypothetical protein
MLCQPAGNLTYLLERCSKDTPRPGIRREGSWSHHAHGLGPAWHLDQRGPFVENATSSITSRMCSTYSTRVDVLCSAPRLPAEEAPQKIQCCDVCLGSYTSLSPKGPINAAVRPADCPDNLLSLFSLYRAYKAHISFNYSAGNSLTHRRTSTVCDDGTRLPCREP